MYKSSRIVITGPESTAKSTLSQQLSIQFGGKFFPEYARLYLDKKGTSYNYSDVIEIAKGQIQQYEASLDQSYNFYFFDTWLIITKVWFEWVYQHYPAWIDQSIENYPIDFYLLCKPDIQWKPDPLRENGGTERIRLFDTYKNELIKRNAKFVEIGGEGKLRLKNAIDAVLRFQKADRKL